MLSVPTIFTITQSNYSKEDDIYYCKEKVYIHGEITEKQYCNKAVLTQGTNSITVKRKFLYLARKMY